MRKKILFLALVLLLIPAPAFAHQPRLVDQSTITVADPEISKAYYGELTGQQHIYRISAKTPFDLYMNVLAPDIAGQSKDVSAIMIKANSPESKSYAMLDGMNYTWTRFWEPYGADWYWKGPEVKMKAEAGDYEIHIFNTMNRGKYTLAIGEIEAFDAKEVWNALRLIPRLKSNFFDESPINFILSPFGWGYILATYILVLVVGLLAHSIVRRLGKIDRQKALYHLAAEHRLLLAGLGICLLLLALATSWNPILIFLSGVCIFEASGISAILSRAK
jgi:hypothetical protein